MVSGISSFIEKFKEFEDQYVIIGGTACDILMSDVGLDFRVTKDIDMVVIVEALTSDFFKAFWDYVKEAEYQHMNKSKGKPEFYRFSRPKSKDYPTMIELFSRKQESIPMLGDSVLTPIPAEDDLSSLSAIILDDEYYSFLKSGVVRISGIPVLDAAYLIPFKAKAWLDLSNRKATGEQVDSRSIKKHKNDIFRLSVIIDSTQTRIPTPIKVKEDMNAFISRMAAEEIDLENIGIRTRSKEEVLQDLEEIYVVE